MVRHRIAENGRAAIKRNRPGSGLVSGWCVPGLAAVLAAMLNPYGPKLLGSSGKRPRPPGRTSWSGSRSASPTPRGIAYLGLDGVLDCGPGDHLAARLPALIAAFACTAVLPLARCGIFPGRFAAAVLAGEIRRGRRRGAAGRPGAEPRAAAAAAGPGHGAVPGPARRCSPAPWYATRCGGIDPKRAAFPARASPCCR